MTINKTETSNCKSKFLEFDNYNVDMTLGKLLEDEVSEKYLRETLGKLLDNPQMQMAISI